MKWTTFVAIYYACAQSQKEVSGWGVGYVRVLVLLHVVKSGTFYSRWSCPGRTQGTEPPIPIPVPIPDFKLPGIATPVTTPDLPGMYRDRPRGVHHDPHPHPRFSRIGDQAE
jgi:hypothetical protein